MMESNSVSRRDALKLMGEAGLATGLGTAARAQRPGDTPSLFMDGHVHITNRVYWEKADFWQPHHHQGGVGRSACPTRC